MMSNSPRRIFNDWEDNGLPAGERHIGQIGKSLIVSSASLIADPDADYAALDYCGTPAVMLEFPNAARVSGGGGVVRSAVFVDRGDLTPCVSLILFSTTTVSTTLTDNSALVIDDSDLAKIVGVITAVTADYTVDANTGKVAFLKDENVYFDLPAGATSLRGVVQADVAWNLGGRSDLGMSLFIERF